MKHNVTNKRGLLVLAVLIMSLYLTGCYSDLNENSNESTQIAEQRADSKSVSDSLEPVFVKYDDTWHIYYLNPDDNEINRLYDKNGVDVGRVRSYYNSAHGEYNTMRLSFEDENGDQKYSYVMVDAILDVDSYRLSLENEGTDDDWSALGLENPNEQDPSKSNQKRKRKEPAYKYVGSFSFGYKRSGYEILRNLTMFPKSEPY